MPQMRRQNAFSRLPEPLQGAAWMFLSSVAFAAMAGAIRHLSAELHPLEIVFFRCAFGVLFILPWFLRGGLGGFRTARIGMFGVRAALAMVAMTCWFIGISILPFAEAVALQFTAPLFGTVVAIFVLGEIVGRRRWAATIIGFAGVLIVLRPGFNAIPPAAFIVLLSALAIGGETSAIRVLARTESTRAIVLYLSLMLTPMTLVPALFVWRMPSPDAWIWLVLLGILATIAHTGLARAAALVEASVMLPLDFLRMPLTALVGYLLFQQVVDVWTWVGAVVIVSATVYIAVRESRLKMTQDRARSRRPE